MSDRPSQPNIINFSNDDIIRISNVLKQSYRSQIYDIVSSIVNGVVGCLNTEIVALKSEILTLRNQVNQLESGVLDIEASIDRQNQCSRRN
ncbi:hypothetical protein DPMN_009430 [Dreissena polymorpha]|uniref:Uncharacterized protein n=1 Tax=Dreissena polymorpha TaxID=45954 RepID=A0A9D4RY25_DREPO|nr:hypothetical protein DPMN_009430 [Dreissena polymorpha]